jgi:hypothetical protein
MVNWTLSFYDSTTLGVWNRSLHGVIPFVLVCMELIFDARSQLLNKNLVELVPPCYQLTTHVFEAFARVCGNDTIELRVKRIPQCQM